MFLIPPSEGWLWGVGMGVSEEEMNDGFKLLPFFTTWLKRLSRPKLLLWEDVR
jgi:hypothetical protein